MSTVRLLQGLFDRRLRLAVFCLLALSGAWVAASQAKTRTVHLSARIVIVDHASGGRCNNVNFLQISAGQGITRYQASVDIKGVGHTTLAGPPFPDDNYTGYGLHYQAPPGTHQWAIGAGAGPAPCNDAAERAFYSHAEATGTQVTECGKGAHDAAARRECCLGPCPIYVELQVKPSGLSGLSFTRGRVKPDPSFLSGSPQLGHTQECRSGCFNVEATVTDKKGDPVPYAHISASVTEFAQVSIAPYPSSDGVSSGHLCRASAWSECSNYLTGLRADRSGHVRLVYWAPGAISQHKVRITVKATSVCAACPGGQRQGEQTKLIAVHQHVVWKETAMLSKDDAELMIAWAKQPGFFSTKTLKEHVLGGPSFESLLQSAVTVLAGEFPAKVGFDVADAFAAIAKEKGQEQRMTAMLLARFNLLPYGIGAPDAQFMDPNLYARIAGSDGLLRHYGDRLDFLDKQYSITPGPQLLKLKVTEVSYCELRQECNGQPGPGAATYLYFDFQGGYTPDQSRHAGVGYPLFEDKFVLSYSPDDWIGIQF